MTLHVQTVGEPPLTDYSSLHTAKTVILSQCSVSSFRFGKVRGGTSSLVLVRRPELVRRRAAFAVVCLSPREVGLVFCGPNRQDWSPKPVEVECADLGGAEGYERAVPTEGVRGQSSRRRRRFAAAGATQRFCRGTYDGGSSSGRTLGRTRVYARSKPDVGCFRRIGCLFSQIYLGRCDTTEK